MAEAAKKSPTRLTIGSPEFPVRFSYLFAFEPKKGEDDDGKETAKYQSQIRIPKADKATKERIDAAVAIARKEKFGDKKITNFGHPLRDGDEEWEEKEDETLKGHWFFNASSKQKPDVVGTEKEEFDGKLKKLGQSEIKSGDYGRVSINLFGYEAKGNKGVGAGLGNIQKLKDGEPLGSQRSADDDFDDLEDGFND